MSDIDVREVILIELHQIIQHVANHVASKLGKPIPEKPPGVSLTPESRAALEKLGILRGAASGNAPQWSQTRESLILSYPPERVLSDEQIEALSALRFSELERGALERVIADACAEAFFDFFCLLDSVSDPDLTKIEHWTGADVVGPRKEGPFLHDEFYERYWDYKKRLEAAADNQSTE